MSNQNPGAAGGAPATSTAGALTTPAAAPTTTPTTAPVTSAPPAGNAPPAAPATTESVAPGSWMAGLSDEARGYAQNKGFKDTAALLDSYRNLEKLQGVPQDRLMKMPEKFYDEQGNLNQDGRLIYERLGAPKDVAGYELKIPDGKQGDQARLDNFLKTAHELGLTKTQAQKLMASDDCYAENFQKAQGEQAVQRFKDSETALRKDWGAAYNDNLQNAREGVKKLGWDSPKIDALSAAIGHADAMKMLAQMGRSMGEASFVGGGSSNANRPMEPAAAKQKIQELTRDSGFAAKLSAGDGDAKALWNRLHEQAFQGTINV